MIVIKVELHSARTGKISEIGRMTISNDGTGKHPQSGNYNIRLMRRSTTSTIQKECRVEGYSRLSSPIWSLVYKALANLGFK